MSSRPPNRDRGAAARSASMAGRGVFVVVVAAGIGLLVLKNGFADGGTTTGGATTTAVAATTTAVAGGTTVPTTVPATAPYKVLVANGSGIAGVAGKTTTFLKAKGIDTIPPVDATKSDYPETVVYFAEGYQAQAEAVAKQLGGVQVAGLIPAPPPVANLGGANVLVVVGKKPIPGVTS